MATSIATAPARPRPSLIYSEILSFAYDTFCSNKIRFALTALGMVIGTASLILVVTIGMTGKQYVLNQIQAIGANLIEAEYQGGAQRITNTTPDPLTIDDMHAAMRDVPASLPHLPSSSSMSVCPSATVKSATFKFWESSPSTASFEISSWSRAGSSTLRTSKPTTKSA